jgi:hypothetical protein
MWTPHARPAARPLGRPTARPPLSPNYEPVLFFFKTWLKIIYDFVIH